jgi:endonuclease YncB( thermonuclease family)
MSYTLLTGDFVIRYPDVPRGGPEPDGDPIRFHPDTPALVEALPRVSGRGPELDARGISVRLEAIDALETHFAGTADAARDRLLAELGFTGVVFIADMPDEVQSADQDRVRGHLLSNAIDAYGRMIGFVFAGEAAEADGTSIDLGDARVNRSLNARLLAAGLVLPAFYATLPDALRAHLARVSRAARAAQDRIWPRSTADPDGAATAAFGR